MFRYLRTYIITETPLTGVDTTDVAMIQDSLLGGHAYVAYDGYEPARGFSFYMSLPESTAGHMGDEVDFVAGSNIHIDTGTSTPTLIRLFHNNKLIEEKTGADMTYTITKPGIYRAEVYQLRRRLPLFRQTPRPWIFSNPIWVIEKPSGNLSE